MDTQRITLTKDVTIGHYLKNLRMDRRLRGKRLTQKTLAKLIDISPQSVYDQESKSHIHCRKIEDWVAALHSIKPLNQRDVDILSVYGAIPPNFLAKHPVPPPPDISEKLDTPEESDDSPEDDDATERILELYRGRLRQAVEEIHGQIKAEANAEDYVTVLIQAAADLGVELVLSRATTSGPASPSRG